MSWCSWERIGSALEGISWVMKTTVSSSAGSTQNAVLARPPQENSPGEQMTLLGTGSSTTAKPRPNPLPALLTSENEPSAMDSRSAPPGRWLRVM